MTRKLTSLVAALLLPGGMILLAFSWGFAAASRTPEGRRRLAGAQARLGPVRARLSGWWRALRWPGAGWLRGAAPVGPR